MDSALDLLKENSTNQTHLIIIGWIAIGISILILLSGIYYGRSMYKIIFIIRICKAKSRFSELDCQTRFV